MPMRMLASLATLVHMLLAADSAEALNAALAAITEMLEFDAYLLIAQQDGAPVAVTLASPLLESMADGRRDAAIALIRRACRGQRFGFSWARLDRRLVLDAEERAVIETGRRHGLVSAFTVPIHGPAADHGSWSLFARRIVALGPRQRLLIQSLAPFVHEAGRLIGPAIAPRPMLTPRQRECVLWAARGKTDWEIAQILGIEKDTVEKQLARARERYGVDKRSMLIVRALFDGTISFEEVLARD